MTAKLEELDALVKAATPGPWDYVDSVVWIATYDSHGEPVQQKVADTGDEANAALIVWLVNNAPAMLRAQAEEIARLREALLPFADEAFTYDADEDTEEKQLIPSEYFLRIEEGGGALTESCIRVGHLRRARDLRTALANADGQTP